MTAVAGGVDFRDGTEGLTGAGSGTKNVVGGGAGQGRQRRRGAATGDFAVPADAARRSFTEGLRPLLLAAPGGDDRVVRRSLLVAVATMVAAALLVWGERALGPRSAGFAFVVVWIPMTWLGTVSRFVRPRLPGSFHRLRDVERDGRLYEHLGVRVAKRLLRRGPLAVFNPDLHLPAERSPQRLAHLDQRMRDAEASHFLLFVATTGVVVNAAARGWWTAATLTAVFNALMNGYPVMLQRYNRALLRRRFTPNPGQPTGER